ncbi:hypothetical protein LINGRAHAP2_LOCUS23382 [Linum grandiflorum]
MHKRTFLCFCRELEEHGGLTSTRNVIVEEHVSIFLRVVTHIEDSRDNADIFQHSTTTISKYFTIILKAFNRFYKRVILPTNFHDVPDCVGAIDGVHIDACILTNQQILFRGRKTTTTHNVMCVCSFDMLFTYVMEGTANDSRVLSETASNSTNQFPMPPLGMIFMVLVNSVIYMNYITHSFIIRQILSSGFWLFKYS